MKEPVPHPSPDEADLRLRFAEVLERERGAIDEIARLRAALDAALDPQHTRFIADYYRGHLSYHGQIKELGPELWERVSRHMEARRGR